MLPPIFVIETCLLILAVLFALIAPARLDKAFRRIESSLALIANRPVLSLVIVALAPIALRLALHPLLHLPQPAFHDEFSYLLAGDTYAHGRLANPPHPLWVFFENMHILQQPTYASQYQPLQEMFLAAGQILTGVPWTGVLISVGMFCAALLWMLRGWVPAEWAFLGAMIAVIRIGVFSYWMNSYWGGAPSALAGALVAGSVPRLLRQGRALHAATLAIGLVLLAASRPYEGLFFSIPFAVVVLVWMIRKRAWKAGVCTAAILLAGLVGLAYFNWRVTGSPFEFPEHAQKRQYAIVPDLIGFKLKPAPEYRHEVMRHYYVEEEPTLTIEVHSFRDLARSIYQKATVFANFFLGPLLALPILIGGFACLTKPFRLLLLGTAFVGFAVATVRWHPNPHYFGPATAAVYGLIVAAMWRIGERGRRGRFLVRAIVIVAIVMGMLRIAHQPLGLKLSPLPMNWSAPWPPPPARQAFLESLEREPGEFVVIVRYLPGHPLGDEWVHNEAAIDNARIVWAHDMGDEKNRELLRYFAGRRILLVERGPDTVTAREYPSPVIR